MNISAEIQSLTADELCAAFRESRIKYTCGYGLWTALQIPSVRRSLELQALALRKKNQQQHGIPAPMKQAA